MGEEREFPPEVTEWLDAVDRERRDDQQRVRDFIEAHKHLPTLERAEAWLSFVAHDAAGSYGDEEAITYLASRGIDVQAAVEQMVARWHRDIRWEVETRAAENSATWHPQGSDAYESGVSLGAVAKVLGKPADLIRNFWSPSHAQDLFIDAALLRVVEWCDIGGFDDWWERFFAQERAEALTAGVEAIPMTYWLANTARSPLARERMSLTLSIRLEAVRLKPTYLSSSPWEHFWASSNPEGPHLTEHYGAAGNIGLATVLVEGEPDDVSLEAARRLLEVQGSEGAWVTWEKKPEPSIDTSARAIHALALNRPRGWRRACEKGAEWLVSQQAEGGYWQEPSMPDARFLTVLVLDALALGAGGTVTTLSSKDVRVPTPEASSSRRFRVALSFPGEARGTVEPIAAQLAETHGEDRVLYDAFHVAEFARPNLDTHLQGLYHDESDLVVVCFGEDYERKEWTGLEWRAIRDLLKSKEDDRIMLVCLDDGPVSGLFSHDGYVDAKKYTPARIAELIEERLSLLAE